MSTASFLPAASRARGRLSVRRMAAWLAACASDPKAAPRLVIGFAAAHAVLWTLILVNLKAVQDVHMDVAEAFAWGQKFQFGYGNTRLWPRDLLADRVARGRSPPRVLRRGDARALSDLQFQGL